MRLTLLAAAALCVSSLAAHADDIFTFTGNKAQVTFVLPSMPSGIPTQMNTAFQITDVEVSDRGVTSSETVNFYLGSSEGGVSVATKKRTLLNVDSKQLFTGSLTMPTFVPGTYSLQQETVGIENPTQLTITEAPIAATPEPSSIALLGTGMLGVAGVIRKRFA